MRGTDTSPMAPTGARLVSADIMGARAGAEWGVAAGAGATVGAPTFGSVSRVPSALDQCRLAGFFAMQGADNLLEAG